MKIKKGLFSTEIEFTPEDLSELYLRIDGLYSCEAESVLKQLYKYLTDLLQ